ncbi:acyl-CoA thioester hydrolase/bile acid acetyltransferase-like protein [Micromonospora endolithica]|nr:acyl-CoA thioester hydrolase/bile acid acetyltransferase-like protein [Micromonospora endolithica]
MTPVRRRTTLLGAAAGRIATLILLLLVGTSSCVRPDHPTRIEVDRPNATADTPVRIRVTGAEPGERVVVRAEAVDRAGVTWRSTASFAADGGGTVDLGADTPVDGSYRGMDAMGLFWSMEPESGSASTGFVPPDPTASRDFVVRLDAVPARSGPAGAQIRRTWLVPGVSVATLRLDREAWSARCTDQVARVGAGYCWSAARKGA